MSTAAAPQAHTEAASSVSYSSAVLNGSVTNAEQGGGYFFQYGTTGKFGFSTPVQPLAPSTTRVHVAQAIAGLQPFTTYHFRLIVTGASAGNTDTFKTPKIPLSVAIVAVPNPVTYGQPFTVEGTLSGTGGGNAEVMLQYNPFPFTCAVRAVRQPAGHEPDGRVRVPRARGHARTRSCASPPSASPRW